MSVLEAAGLDTVLGREMEDFEWKSEFSEGDFQDALR